MRKDVDNIILKYYKKRAISNIEILNNRVLINIKGMEPEEADSKIKEEVCSLGVEKVLITHQF